MSAEAVLFTDLARDFLARHPADAARAMADVDTEEGAELLGGVTPATAAGILSRLGPDAAARLLGRTSRDRVWSCLLALDPADAAAILRRLDDDVDAPGLLASLPAAQRRDLETFMSYPDGSAGSLMDGAAPIFREDARTGDVEAAMRDMGRTDDHVIVVVDAEGRLVGTLDTVRVLLADARVRLQDLRPRQVPTVDAFAAQEEVAGILDTHQISALPVVDIEGRPLGVLRHHELATVAEQDATADMQSMVGASREERALSPVSFVVRKRLPWLQINLVTAFLAASVVGLFEATIAQFTALAVLLPVVAGQSGNTGAQSLAVTMRGLTLHEIGLRQWLPVVWKEAAVGLLNGIAVALVTMAGVYVWSGSLGLCLVIGLAMVVSMTIAGVAGAGVPLVLRAVGQDPAQSSSIVLTTVTDIMGFFSFLGLAALFSTWL
jgi:magnesium transporter